MTTACRCRGRRTVEDMWKEIEAECIRTIERGAVDETIYLSRRHRWKPLAFDVNGEVAVVVVAQRGKRTGGSIHGIAFHRRRNTWVCVGSPGVIDGGPEDRQLPPRVRRAAVASSGRVEGAHGSSGLGGGRSAVASCSTVPSRSARASRTSRPTEAAQRWPNTASAAWSGGGERCRPSPCSVPTSGVWNA